MSLTLTTRPLRTNLCDPAMLRRDLEVTTEAEGALSDAMAQATTMVETFCQRVFARVVVQETCKGYGEQLLMLSRTPVVLVSSVLHDGAVIADYTVDDANAGFLYRAGRWTWTGGTGWYLTDYMPPRSEEPTFTVAYTAGFLLPDDDVRSSALAVNGTTKAFTITGATFPLLVAGDVVVSDGFATAANNGTWTVVSRTATTVVVSEAGLVTETAGTEVNPKTLRVRTLPADVTRAANDVAKGVYFAQHRDPLVAARSITGLSIQYAVGGGSGRETLALPPTAAGLLVPYRRAA